MESVRGNNMLPSSCARSKITIFDNELTDFDDDVEKGCSSPKKPESLLSERTEKSKARSERKRSSKNETDFIREETFPMLCRKDSETESTFGCSSKAISGVKDQADGSTLSKNDDTVGKNEAKIKQIDREKFASNWLLEEKDLRCLPLILNKKRLQELKAQKLQSHAGLPEPYSHTGHSKRSPRKRAGKGSSHLIFSPLRMVVNFAKLSGYDLNTLLETSDYLAGKEYQLPCMQCYEKFGVTEDAWFESSMDDTIVGANKSYGRCSSCGGQVQTLASFCKMLKQMGKTLDAKDLVPYDVYPDGNCLFSAIVDQLRLRGDFSFTPHSLRLSAVNYLRKNPTSDDGTPLHMFITGDETWDSYLARMSIDGEWGDHIILRALTNVIGLQIAIYGGMTGQSETILSPKRLTVEFEKTSSSKTESQKDIGVIYLGHIGEIHYLSLRPKRWRESLRKGLQKRRDAMEFKCHDTPVKHHNMMQCSIQHINLIIRQVFRVNFIKSSELTDMLVPSRHETKDCIHELFGSVMCKLVPDKLNVESLESDISIFFPSLKEEATKECFKTSVVCCVSTPKDTNIVSTMDSAKSVDLLAENDAVDIGRTVLIPKIPILWKGQTECLNGTKRCLKTFDIDMDIFDKILPKKTKETPLNINQVLGFKCAWPDVAKEWPDRHRESAFPGLQTIHTVVEAGCHVIPLIPNVKIVDFFDDPVQCMVLTDDHIWCYSFFAAEKEICRFLSPEQRQCYFFFKALVDASLTDIPIPSSVARSIFFYACEKLDKQFWKSNPGECLLVLLKKLSDCFNNRILPHYFMQEKNLLHFIPEKTLDECFRRLECARLQPVVSLYFLLDQLNVMSSEIGGFVEEIIENMIKEGQTNPKVGPSNRALLPAYTGMIQSLIYKDDYHGAMLVFQDIIEESGGSLKTDGFAEMKRLLWRMHIGHQWCFALYIDIQQQTTMTAQLSEVYAPVHITEIFGPDCTKELPDTLVPECFSIPKGDLIFYLKVSNILYQNMSHNMYIRCMKFYLKQYAEIAGESLAIPYTEYEFQHTAAVEKGKTKAVVAHWYELHLLQEVYVDFYNHCFHSLKIEEFRDMMPLYAAIAEMIGSRLCWRNLYSMWSTLGERKKSDYARKKLSMI